MISIRKLTLEDVKTTYAYSSDHENTYYMLNSPFSAIGEAEAFLCRRIAEYESEHPEYLSFAVTYQDVHVGEVFASIFEKEKEAEIGWIIDKHYWGKGIATRAAELFVDHLKKEYGIECLRAYCDARNAASKRVIEKIGMRFAGENGVRFYDKDYNKEVPPGVELVFSMRL